MSHVLLTAIWFQLVLPAVTASSGTASDSSVNYYAPRRRDGGIKRYRDP